MALWAAVVGLGTMSACIVSRRAVAHVFRLASKLAYWNRYGQADRLTVRRTWARQFSLQLYCKICGRSAKLQRSLTHAEATHAFVALLIFLPPGDGMPASVIVVLRFAPGVGPDDLGDIP